MRSFEKQIRERLDREQTVLLPDDSCPATCTECGHLHYYGLDVWGKCRVCDACPNDPRNDDERDR